MKNFYKEAEADDFIHFGLLPELIGRSPIRTFVNLLSKNDLIRIMEDTEDSILNQYKMEFKLFNVDIEFTSNAIEYTAEISENRKTGARALVSVWDNILTDFQFEPKPVAGPLRIHTHILLAIRHIPSLRRRLHGR